MVFSGGERRTPVQSLHSLQTADRYRTQTSNGNVPIQACRADGDGHGTAAYQSPSLAEHDVCTPAPVPGAQGRRRLVAPPASGSAPKDIGQQAAHRPACLHAPAEHTSQRPRCPVSNLYYNS